MKKTKRKRKKDLGVQKVRCCNLSLFQGSGVWEARFWGVALRGRAHSSFLAPLDLVWPDQDLLSQTVLLLLHRLGLRRLAGLWATSPEGGLGALDWPSAPPPPLRTGPNSRVLTGLVPAGLLGVRGSAGMTWMRTATLALWPLGGFNLPVGYWEDTSEETLVDWRPRGVRFSFPKAFSGVWRGAGLGSTATGWEDFISLVFRTNLILGDKVLYMHF